MRRKGKLALMCAAFLFLLTACWNSKDIQSMAYVTAIGCDYENGKYITYAQVLNFSNVAKGESVEIGKNIPTWIGQGEGFTLTESFNSIYTTSQLRLFWGHVRALVVTERFLKKGEHVIKEAYDMLNRYREIRYNILVYGTKEPIRDILSQKSNLNLSPLETIMDNPTQGYSQRSYILPTYSFKFKSLIDEPAGAVLLPSLSIDRKSWTEDKKKKSMFSINGAYLMSNNQVRGWLSEQDLSGYRWIEKDLMRSPINIPDNSHPDAAIVLIKPKPKIEYVFRNGKTFYTIKLSIQAYVDELVRDLSKKDIEEQSAKVIEKQIRATYEKGLSIKADVLNLTEHLYRYNPKLWRNTRRGESFLLDKDSLERIEVTVHLLHSGKYKLRAG
ncbi:Ger(x)C family spore germination protein [Paenibacillus spongiae]|uniref:Ger(X)C family spore germination protein n=1 Tax=Paenibacillus spongiae TaxID=2909671 RepID=A0ABY5SL84_9BACL|nr:Ger(x)C family spore germination protein [Paenibacillus spongiae]UVI33013.1 Ger(x)C family spore germination protein [Paenibacillus spongiae]